MKNRDQMTRLRLALSMLFVSLYALMLLPDQVSAKQVQAEYLNVIVYKPSGFSGVMHFYSDGSKVSYIDVDKGTLHARWVSFIPLSAFDEGVELYYSRDGITTEKQFIKMQNWDDAPADLKWLTISNFDGAFGEGHAITNQQYRYSVDGIHVLSGPEVPANALWATLSEYETVWSGEHKTLDYDRSYETYTLDIDPISSVAIASNHATNTSIAKAGHEVTLSFTAIFPLKKATVTIAGHPIEAKEQSGKWTARYRLTSADAEGEIAFRIDYEEADSDIVKSRTETTDGSSVRFDNTPPAIVLKQAPMAWTRDNVQVTAQVTDDGGSGVEAQKWAAGQKNIADFQSGGNIAAGNSFSASANGVYTWYAKDRAGNEAVKSIEIANIDRIAPTLKVQYEPREWTNAPIEVAVAAEDEQSGVQQLKWSEGPRTADYFESNGTMIVNDSFAVQKNGAYTVYAADRAGNWTIRTFTVANIDRTPPGIALSSSTETPTNKEVTVTASIVDEESGTAVQKWAPGKQSIAFFANGGNELAGNSFNVSDNGAYTVYAKDRAGNEAVATIEVTNIHRLEPVISLTLFPTEPTQGPVTVTASVYSPIDIADRKMALGRHDAAFFHSEGEPWSEKQPLEVQDNGWISLYATDTAGNETVKQLEITNIDREKPIITLLGDPVIHVVQGTAFQDPGASAMDNTDGDISASIIASGQVNAQIPGEYILRYNVTDKAGNAADEVLRTVKVTPRPVVDDHDNGGSHGGGNTSPQDDLKVPAQVPQHNDPKGKEEPKRPAVPEDNKQCPPEGPCDNTGSLPRFTDVEGHWASEAILELAAAGVITGYPDGTFKPSRSLTRAEFVTLLVHALKLEMQQEPIFTDAANHWASEAISIAQEYGLIKGYNANTFGPDDRITREQMAAVIARMYMGDKPASSEELPALAYEDAADISAWAADAVHWVTGQQIMIGNHQRQFRPKAFTSRAEAAVVLAKLRAKST